MDDISCRIVIVSSKLSKGDVLVQKLKQVALLSKRNKKVPVDEEAENGRDRDSDEDDDEEESVAEPVFHPWSISNRYYSAKVHFALHSISKCYPAVFEGVPALIVAWSNGEPIEQYMKDVQKAMGGHEPEILLGVRLPSTQRSADASPIDETKGDDEDDDIDSMLMTYGFEYIDASRPMQTSQSTWNNDEGGVPNLPRVLDALSTYMWPSMSNAEPSSPSPSTLVSSSPSSTRRPTARDVLRTQSTLEHIINRDPMAILQALEELDSEFHFDDGDDDDDEYNTFREIASLENDSNGGTASTSILRSFDGSTPDEMSLSPTGMEFDNTSDYFSDLSKPFGLSPSRDESGIIKPKVSLRFEDDFNAFVTAPPHTDDDIDTPDAFEDSFRSRLEINPERENTFDYDLLRSADPTNDFTSGGSLYRSLGSVSDLGDMDEPSGSGDTDKTRSESATK